MSKPSTAAIRPIRRQAADALRRARKLPIGHARNDLRQLAVGLLWLEKRGHVAIPEDLVRESEWRNPRSSAIAATPQKMTLRVSPKTRGAEVSPKGPLEERVI